MPYLWTWSPWNRYSNWGARRHGDRDGKKGIPKLDQKLNPPYIMQLKQIGDQGIEQFEEEYHRKDARLLGDYCRLKREEEVLNETLRKSRDERDRAKESEIDAQREYVKHFHVKPMTYWVALLLISVGEFVINTVVFQILGDDKQKTMLAAIGVGVAVPWLGHALGGQFRQGFLDKGKIGRHAVTIIVILVAVIGGLVALSYIRQKFFQGSGIDKMLNIQMDPASVTAAFILLNLMLFVAASIASYLHHYPEALGHILNSKHAGTIRRHEQKKVGLLERRLAQNTAQLAQVSADRLKLYEMTGKDIGDWKSNTQRLISVYQEHNLHARNDGEMPVCFGAYPPIDVAPLFDKPSPSKLSWDCRGVFIDSIQLDHSGNNSKSASDNVQIEIENPPSPDVESTHQVSDSTNKAT